MKIPLSSLILAFAPPAALLSGNLLRVTFFPDFDQLDPVFHLFGGFAVAWSAWNIYLVLRDAKYLPKLPLGALAYFFASSAVFVGVLWEFYEYMAYSRDPLSRQLAWWTDTIFDLAVDLIGGLFFFLAHVTFRKTPRS